MQVSATEDSVEEEEEEAEEVVAVPCEQEDAAQSLGWSERQRLALTGSSA